MNEYSVAKIAVSRLDEARQAAAQRRLLLEAGIAGSPFRTEVGRMLVRLGQWLGGPGLTSRQAAYR